MIEAIVWKYRTGSPWREVPECFGPWQTAYERHTRWTVDGTWARLLAAAQAEADAAGGLDWLVSADSSLVRVHQHGAAARRVGGNAATVAGPAPAGRTGGRAGMTTILCRNWPTGSPPITRSDGPGAG